MLKHTAIWCCLLFSTTAFAEPVSQPSDTISAEELGVDLAKGFPHYDKRPEAKALAALEKSLGMLVGTIKVTNVVKLGLSTPLKLKTVPDVERLAAWTPSRLKYDKKMARPERLTYLLRTPSDRPTAIAYDGKIIALKIESYELKRTRSLRYDPDNFVTPTIYEWQPLAAFKQLQVLNLGGKVQNFNDLPTLNNLRELEISLNKYNAPTTLQLPPRLQVLDARIDITKIKIAAHNTLRHLRINQKTLQHLTLNSLPNLASIHAEYASLEQLNVEESGLPNLKHVYLKFKKPTHLPWLSNTTCPANVSLHNAELKGATPFSGKCLTRLELSGDVALSSLKQLPKAPKLKEASFKLNQLASLQGLEHFPTISQLSIDGSKSLSFQGLKKHATLEELEISNTHIPTLNGIEALLTLKNVTFKKLKIDDTEKTPSYAPITKLACLQRFKHDHIYQPAKILAKLGPAWRDMKHLTSLKRAAFGMGSNSTKTALTFSHEKLISNKYDSGLVIEYVTSQNSNRLRLIPKAEQCTVNYYKQTGAPISVTAAEKRKSSVYKASKEKKPLPPGYTYLHVRPEKKGRYGKPQYSPDTPYTIYFEDEKMKPIKGRTDRDGTILEPIPKTVEKVSLLLGEIGSHDAAIWDITLTD